ncbi:uncharacterized protein LOC130612435 [Hydractinia symbiolongicarpus]|uniref:uncharacterized protein LOC130612435 n=1 Tax=Hydractinia symbiolongicarpus TaxID=13093 RepID=UPI00255060CC|nr:uncharacterized protein LOC130612435 [Hydractinia symbiolongicarpus]
MERGATHTSPKVGVVIVEDADLWGGSLGLWRFYKKRFEHYKEEMLLEPIYAITEKLPDMNEVKSYRGFIITGSNYSVNDDFDWIKNLINFVKNIMNLQCGPKLFGICFGHQIIGKALGGKVGRNLIGHDVFGTGTIYVSKYFSETASFRKCFGERQAFKIMQGHGESVLDVPDDAEVIGWSETCLYEVVLWNNRVISTQGHPEFTTDVMKHRITPFLREHKILTNEQLTKSLLSFSDIDTANTAQFVKIFLTE